MAVGLIRSTNTVLACAPCLASRERSKASHSASQAYRSPPYISICERRGQGRATRATTLAVEDAEISPTHSIDLEPVAEGDFCLPGEVSVDNHSNKDATVLSVEVKDYPGLLRVVAWVLNGLDYVVQSARLTTDDDGFAHNRFWVVYRNGSKLSNNQAELLAERVGDFVVYCTPNRQMMQAETFGDDNVKVINNEHEQYSVIRLGGSYGPGALLQIASAMTGVGVSIHEAVIQGCTQCGAPEVDPNFDHGARNRLFKFWVSDRHGDKLDYARATTLVYTLGLAFGGNLHGPINAPGSSFGQSNNYN